MEGKRVLVAGDGGLRWRGWVERVCGVVEVIQGLIMAKVFLVVGTIKRREKMRKYAFFGGVNDGGERGQR